MLATYVSEHDLAMPTVTVFCDLAAYSRYLVARGTEPIEAALAGLMGIFANWLEGYDAPHLLTALASPQEHIIHPAMQRLGDHIRVTRNCQSTQVNIGIFGISFVIDSYTPVVTTPIVYLVRMELPLSAVVHMSSRMDRPSPCSPPEMPRILRLSVRAISHEQLMADAATLNQHAHALGMQYRQALTAEPPRYIFTIKSSCRACTAAFLEDFQTFKYSPCSPDAAFAWVSTFQTLADAVDAELAGIHCLRRQPWPALTNSNPPEWALARARNASLARLENYLSWLLHRDDFHYRAPAHRSLVAVLMARITVPRHRGVAALLAAPEDARRRRRHGP